MRTPRLSFNTLWKVCKQDKCSCKNGNGNKAQVCRILSMAKNFKDRREVWIQLTKDWGCKPKIVGSGQWETSALHSTLQSHSETESVTYSSVHFMSSLFVCQVQGLVLCPFRRCSHSLAAFTTVRACVRVTFTLSRHVCRFPRCRKFPLRIRRWTEKRKWIREWNICAANNEN